MRVFVKSNLNSKVQNIQQVFLEAFTTDSVIRLASFHTHPTNTWSFGRVCIFRATFLATRCNVPVSNHLCDPRAPFIAACCIDRGIMRKSWFVFGFWLWQWKEARIHTSVPLGVVHTAQRLAWMHGKEEVHCAVPCGLMQRSDEVFLRRLYSALFPVCRQSLPGFALRVLSVTSKYRLLRP